MSDMSIISAILVVVVAFLAGLEGILDQFQFHQPLVACTLIGAATGNLTAGIMLGGSLQMIALAWANIGAAVAPDAALASVAAAIILVKGGNFTQEGIGVATATAIPLAVAGLFLTMLVRTASVALVHTADKAAENGNIAGVERAHYLALVLQGWFWRPYRRYFRRLLGRSALMAEKTQLSKSDRQKVWWRSQFLQGSWNYERMQNLGWAYSLIPAIKKLYSKKEDQAAALKRHLEFFNTHPYVAAPIMGVTLALEEEKANGTPIEDAAVQGVKIGMMGPLAGIGDPVFWFTIRPILGALGASLAASGNIAGPLIFFIGWNIIRMAFLWYTQELGYKAGSEITKDMSGGILKDITKGASILGMFILAVLVERWVSINFIVNLPGKVLSKGAYIVWPKGNVTGDQLKTILGQVNDKLSFDKIQVDTLQKQLDSLIPGLMGLLLTFACMWLLKKKVSPITIIIGLFVVGIIASFFKIM